MFTNDEMRENRAACWIWVRYAFTDLVLLMRFWTLHTIPKLVSCRGFFLSFYVQFVS